MITRISIVRKLKMLIIFLKDKILLIDSLII